MRASDLDLKELLQVDPAGGVLRFGNERVVLLDAVALGLLRRELIDTLGMAGARATLTRFGYAHGWRTADNLHTAFPWASEHEWRLAGGRLHTLQGHVRPIPWASPAELTPSTVVNWVWEDSYEAEQHLLHLGRADEPVCWTLVGFVSGYTSRAYGQDVYVVEHQCRGEGAAVCRLEGRTVEGWGDTIDPHLPYYQGAALDDVLANVTEELKRTEHRLRRRRRELRDTGDQQESDHGSLTARSEAMRRTLDLARRVAQVDSTVLLTGESGVGKERVARYIHENSTRAGGPFVAINCGAVPENLLESELFGHARGSFTGATQDRIGLFESANGGTLLLDEIGETTPALQVKLLRALQEREIRRVGENRLRPVNARVIAATNRDLVSDINSARFREDLYYRLRVVEIRIPPLRERRDDVLALAREFVEAAAARSGRKVTGFTPDAAQRLLAYPWRGNVRELENAMERAVVMAARSRVDVEDLPSEIGLAVPEPLDAEDVRTLEQVERDYILSVLRTLGGNRAQAATKLGIGTATLYRKLKLFGLGQ